MSESPETMLASYVEAFSSQDADAVVHFYQLPCSFIRPDGVWVASDRETAVTVAAHMIDHARNQGHARTEILGLAVRRLADVLAELSGVFVRYDAANSEIGRFGFTYVARRSDNQWQIVVAIAHDAVA
jgi:ketosteroid isomerase-like protein